MGKLIIKIGLFLIVRIFILLQIGIFLVGLNLIKLRKRTDGLPSQGNDFAGKFDISFFIVFCNLIGRFLGHLLLDSIGFGFIPNIICKDLLIFCLNFKLNLFLFYGNIPFTFFTKLFKIIDKFFFKQHFLLFQFVLFCSIKYGNIFIDAVNRIKAVLFCQDQFFIISFSCCNLLVIGI